MVKASKKGMQNDADRSSRKEKLDATDRKGRNLEYHILAFALISAAFRANSFCSYRSHVSFVFLWMSCSFLCCSSMSLTDASSLYKVEGVQPREEVGRELRLEEEMERD